MNPGCKLCQTRTSIIPGISEPVYYHCPNCDLIFMDESFYLDAAAERTRYEQHNNTCENEGYVQMFRDFIQKTVQPHLEGIDTALDFGCGPGPVLATLLREMGISTDIYDPYFFPRREYRGKHYDLITSTEVFEHLSQPLETLQLLISLLNNNGILAIMTLFHPPIEDFPNWWYHRDPTHICFYSTQTLTWIAQHFNLDILYLGEKNKCAFRILS